MGGWNNAVEARDWLQLKDESGDTNFMKVLRTVSAWCMEPGRTMVKSSEIRGEFSVNNNWTPAIMRFLVMADRSMAEYILWRGVPELDDDPDEFARLFSEFGAKPQNRNHIQARDLYRAERKSREQSHKR